MAPSFEGRATGAGKLCPELAVDAVLRLKGSGNLDAIQIIKIPGGRLDESFLDSGG